MRVRPRRGANPARSIGEVIRRLRCSVQTEQGPLGGIGRFMLFHGKRHPEERVAVPEQAFLVVLAVKRNVASSTYNDAPNAIVFLYRQILRKGCGWLEV